MDRFSDRDGRVPKRSACTIRMGGTCPHKLKATWIRTCVCSFVIASYVLGAVPSASAASEITIKGMVGGTVELPCDVDKKSCGEVYFLSWNKYQQASNDWKRLYLFSDEVEKPLQEFAKPSRASFAMTETMAFLTITPLKLEDEGNYRCEITYVQGNCPSRSSANLVTIAKPEPPVLEKEGKVIANGSTVGPYYEGETLKLDCKSKGGKPTPEVTWWQGSNFIKADVDVDKDSLGRSSVTAALSIELSREHIGSKLECQVLNEAIEEPLVAAVQLELYVTPKSLEIEGPQTDVIAGQSVTLTCKIIGAKPAATATWFNETDPINVTSKPEEILEDDGTITTISTLNIVVSRHDHGKTFYCKGSNSALTHTRPDRPLLKSIKLQVLYPPVVVIGPTGGLIVNETKTKAIYCSFYANPSNFSDVIWYKNGVEIPVNDNPKYTSNSPKYPILTINNISRSDSGQYSCSLSNKIGRGNSTNTVEISVLFPPTVRASVSPPVVEEGPTNRVSLICDILDGNPENLLNIRWYKNDEILNETTGREISYIDVTRNMTGNYSCEGENAAGWGERSNNRELIVNYVPGKAIIVQKNTEVVKGDTVSFECIVEDMGRPEATVYQWEYEGQPISEARGPNYTTRPIDVNNRGNYSCAAFNNVGIGQRAYAYVTAAAPPSFVENLPATHGAVWNAGAISVSCRVECEPICNITWTKDGESIMDSEFYDVKTNTLPEEFLAKRFQSVVSTLFWNMSAWPGGTLDRQRDSANYTCQSSSNGFGPGVSSSMYFMVEYPPENIVVSPPRVDVIQGGIPGTLNCSASSWPPSEYFWEFSNIIISVSPELYLNYTITRERAGKYRCVASNRHGRLEAEVLVNVMYVPECMISEAKNEDHQTMIICEVQANPPNVAFSWLRNNESVEMEYVTNDRKSTLTIPEESSAYFGMYQCTASNAVGESKPCLLEITGEEEEPGWVPILADDDVILIAGITAAVVLLFIIILIIIILVMRSRRMRNASSPAKPKAGTPVDPLYQNVEKDGKKENGPSSELPETKAMYENMSFHQKPKGPKTPIPAVRTRICPTPGNQPRLYENIVLPKAGSKGPQTGENASGTAFILPRIQRPASATWVRPKPTPRKTDATSNGTKEIVLSQTLPRPAKSIFLAQDAASKEPETDANKNITTSVANDSSVTSITNSIPISKTQVKEVNVTSTKPFCLPTNVQGVIYADLALPNSGAKPMVRKDRTTEYATLRFGREDCGTFTTFPTRH